MEKYIQPIIMLIISGAVGAIGFFVSRAFSSLDKCATKEELSALDERLDERIGKNEKAIEKIREDYITKEDFFREQAKTDKKLDRIMDILLEMKGGK